MCDSIQNIPGGLKLPNSVKITEVANRLAELEAKVEKLTEIQQLKAEIEAIADFMDDLDRKGDLDKNAFGAVAVRLRQLVQPFSKRCNQ